MKFLYIIKDIELSFSISYPKSFAQTYNITFYLIDKDMLLNTKGKEIYNDIISQDKFALICGDGLINSFNKGI